MSEGRAGMEAFLSCAERLEELLVGDPPEQELDDAVQRLERAARSAPATGWSDFDGWRIVQCGRILQIVGFADHAARVLDASAHLFPDEVAIARAGLAVEEGRREEGLAALVRIGLDPSRASVHRYGAALSLERYGADVEKTVVAAALWRQCVADGQLENARFAAALIPKSAAPQFVQLAVTPVLA